MKESKLLYRSKEGFSLIELIITIALMALFVGLAALSIGLLTASDSKGLASHINDSITDLKAYTEQSSGPQYLHIYKSSKGYFAKFDSSSSFTVPSNDDDSIRLGSSNLKVEWFKEPGVGYDLDDDPATVSIRKKDGAFTGNTPHFFEIIDDGTTEFKVILAKDTGLHYVE